MKLIDFLEYQQFEELRRVMGATLVPPISKINYTGLTEEEIRQITGDGIDIEDINVLTIGDDKTLIYKNTRVLLYIRDWSFNPKYSNDTMPRFHLSNCSTLQTMASSGRSNRYVIATRDDGLFKVNKIVYKQIESERDVKLEVCKNCLKNLNWDDYSFVGKRQQTEIYHNFKISKFFEKYPKSILKDGIHKKENEAPINNYSDDWDKISSTLRASKKWTCEECGTDMSNKKQLLDVHHINGEKNDNRLSNLKVLCRSCHSKQPNHKHLRF